MTAKRRAWVIAIGVWVFLAIWLAGLSGSLFSGACRKPGLSADQRLFRCGWAWALSTPFRSLGDPPQRYVPLRMTLGIAQAELNRPEDALRSFADAIRLAGLSPPVDLSRERAAAPSAASDLFARVQHLPPDSLALALFLKAAAGTGP